MAVDRGHHVTIDIEKMVSSIKDMSMSTKCCIFKTPIILRRLNVKAYVPDAFSFGPFHHGDGPRLKATEKIKIKYLQGLLSRSHSPKERLRNLVNSVMDVEKEARECYAEPIDCETNDFVQILVIDGCFIIELLRKFAFRTLREKDDPIFTMSCMLEFLYHDLILLENQVPWMVLELLFNMTIGPEHRYPLSELAQIFFCNIFSRKPLHIDSPNYIENIMHIPDLIREWTISLIEEDEESSELFSWEPIPSATSLAEAGIKFKPGKSKSILGIKFDKGVLEIPSLLIQETTETTIRNLISFEQCYTECDARFTSYAILIDSLINNAQDAELLGKNKIVYNWLSPEDTAKFFNKLYYDTYVNKY